MTTVMHLEVLVEEPSMEAFLRVLLPRFLPQQSTFDVHTFQGKSDLLCKLESRLRGYASWLPDGWRVFVLVDKDCDDCHEIKRQLEASASRAGLRTRTQNGARTCQVVNRIAIEELEAWYFSEWAAVRTTYPRAGATVPNQRGFRNPDAIAGGTWEAFERVMQRFGYFQGGLTKLEAARRIGAHFDPTRSSSASFQAFWSAVMEAVA
jgi:hypothetical protein